MNWLCEPNTCPGLFYGTSACDGFLLRLRTPGGLISLPQGEAIARLMENCGKDSLQVTNRANLQIRGLETSPSPEIYQKLQQVGLAGKQPKLDHLRNIMTSPTVGIDPRELIDTRPLVTAILNYIEEHPELKELSAKFSIGIDGGGQVGLGTRSPRLSEHRYNEIQFFAVKKDGQVCLHLALGGERQLWDTGILIKPENCVSLLNALITVYLNYIRQNQSEKTPRLKHLLRDWGLSTYLDQVTQEMNFSAGLTKIGLTPSLPYSHLGIEQQKQEGLSYLGMGLPLGHITLKQWKGLLNLAADFGSGEIRLTPWQSILVPNLPTEKLELILPQLEKLNLSHCKNQIEGAIVACAGKPGCGSAITQTQLHGMALIQYLQKRLKPKYPVNIHLTGCPKSCAQPSPAEITLLGTMIEQEGKLVEGYKIYLGDDQYSLKYQVAELPFVAVPQMLEKLITLSQNTKH